MLLLLSFLAGRIWGNSCLGWLHWLHAQWLPVTCQKSTLLLSTDPYLWSDICMFSVTGICLWWGNGETWFLYICVDTENVCGFQEIVELGGDVAAPVWLGSLPACLWSIQTTHEQVSRCLGARSAADLCKCSPLVHSLCLCICLPVSSSLALACCVFVHCRTCQKLALQDYQN